LALFGLSLALWLGPAVSVHAGPAGPVPATGWVEWLTDAWSRWHPPSGVETAAASAKKEPGGDEEPAVVVSSDGPALTEPIGGDGTEQFPGLDPNG